MASSNRDAILKPIAIHGTTLLEISAKMTQWVKEGWLSRWWLAVHVGQAVVSTLEAVGQTRRWSRPNRCGRVAFRSHVDGIVSDVEAQFVGLTVNVPGLDSAACQPRSVAAVAAFTSVPLFA